MLRLFVGRLPVDITEAELRASLAKVGVLVGHVELVVNRATGAHRGFAFTDVAAAPEEEVRIIELIRHALHGLELDVRRVPEVTRGAHEGARCAPARAGRSRARRSASLV